MPDIRALERFALVKQELDAIGAVMKNLRGQTEQIIYGDTPYEQREPIRDQKFGDMYMNQSYVTREIVDSEALRSFFQLNMSVLQDQGMDPSNFFTAKQTVQMRLNGAFVKNDWNEAIKQAKNDNIDLALDKVCAIRPELIDASAQYRQDSSLDNLIRLYQPLSETARLLRYDLSQSKQTLFQSYGVGKHEGVSIIEQERHAFNPTRFHDIFPEVPLSAKEREKIDMLLDGQEPNYPILTKGVNYWRVEIISEELYLQRQAKREQSQGIDKNSEMPEHSFDQIQNSSIDEGEIDICR